MSVILRRCTKNCPPKTKMSNGQKKICSCNQSVKEKKTYFIKIMYHEPSVTSFQTYRNKINKSSVKNPFLGWVIFHNTKLKFLKPNLKESNFPVFFPPQFLTPDTHPHRANPHFPSQLEVGVGWVGIRCGQIDGLPLKKKTLIFFCVCHKLRLKNQNKNLLPCGELRGGERAGWGGSCGEAMIFFFFFCGSSNFKK